MLPHPITQTSPDVAFNESGPGVPSPLLPQSPTRDSLARMVRASPPSSFPLALGVELPKEAEPTSHLSTLQVLPGWTKAFLFILQPPSTNNIPAARSPTQQL